MANCNVFQYWIGSRSRLSGGSGVASEACFFGRGNVWLPVTQGRGRTSASDSTPWSPGSTRRALCRSRATKTDGIQTAPRCRRPILRHGSTVGWPRSKRCGTVLTHRRCQPSLCWSSDISIQRAGCEARMSGCVSREGWHVQQGKGLPGQESEAP